MAAPASAPQNGLGGLPSAPVWITRDDAARILECHVSTVDKYSARGLLTRRGARRSLPSLDLAEVEAFADRRRLELAAREEATRRRDARRLPGPPDDRHDWLNTTQAARILAISRARVGQKASNGTLPFSEVNGRRWFRRDHLELVRGARLAAVHRDASIRLSGLIRDVDTS